MKLEEISAAVAPYLPPAFGALMNLPYAKNQTPAQRVVSWAVGTAVGLYVGGAFAEWLTLGPRATIAAGFIFGAAGYDLMLGITAAARGFGADPMGSVRGWLATWFNRSPS
jgi:hypothetical protein